jgi:hypothetical protein
MAKDQRKDRDFELLRPTDVRPGKQIAFEGVTTEIMEVHKVISPFRPDTYIVAYRIHDNRQAPPFISGIGHLYVNSGTNLIVEFRKVRDQYEQMKSSVRVKSSV